MVTKVVHTSRPLAAYQPLTISTPTPDTPEVKSPIQSVHAWRQQKKMEVGAFGPDEQHVFTSDLECACCEIFIGKDHYEQELYLYPLWWEEVKLAKGYLTYDHLVVVRLCGSCARSRMCLSDDLQVFDHTVWQIETSISLYRVKLVTQCLQHQVGFVLWLSYWLKRYGHTIPPWHWWTQWISPLVLPGRVTLQDNPTPKKQEQSSTRTQLKQALARLGTLQPAPDVQVAC
jgi:hypothetical protein